MKVIIEFPDGQQIQMDLNKTKLQNEVQRRAGCITLRKTRSTKKLVGLYHSKEAGIETDPELPYATVCEEHGGVVCHRTLKAARSWLSHPEEWCPHCQDLRGKK